LKTWFITGCSSGLGRALAEHVLARGDHVVATARDPGRLAALAARFGVRALCLPLDVAAPEDARSALSRAFERFGRIDVLVNNAGYGLQSTVEDATDAQIRAVFETNVFGVLNVTRAALPQLRAQGEGHIINVSSTGGRLSAPLIGIYSATKFAVEGFSLALAAELAPLGLKVTVIEPGALATNFSTTSIIRIPASEPYKRAAKQTEAYLASALFEAPARAARAIATVADLAEPPLQLPLGSSAFDRISASLDRQRDDLSKWRALSLSMSEQDSYAEF
jgi:NAD(P)-dependent dehydrogenase (short-subunit alcohol dehydrogenase family)